MESKTEMEKKGSRENRVFEGFEYMSLEARVEFTQTHVHRVGDTIQPSHPLASPSPPAPNPSQHQSLFQ